MKKEIFSLALVLLTFGAVHVTLAQDGAVLLDVQFGKKVDEDTGHTSYVNPGDSYADLSKSDRIRNKFIATKVHYFLNDNTELGVETINAPSDLRVMHYIKFPNHAMAAFLKPILLRNELPPLVYDFYDHRIDTYRTIPIRALSVVDPKTNKIIPFMKYFKEHYGETFRVRSEEITHDEQLESGHYGWWPRDVIQHAVDTYYGVKPFPRHVEKEETHE